MRRAFLRVLATGCCCIWVLSLAACDARELVAPGLRPEGRTRTALSEPVSLGSNLLPPPPNTSGAPGTAVTLGTIPANTWVVFQVSGSISGSWNPDCSSRPPAWPCAAGAMVQPFTSGADPYAPVTITYTYEEGGTHAGRVLLRGTSENSAVGLYQLSLPSTLAGFVKANTLTSWDPNFGVMIPSYINLSGGYTVTATMVPSPFRVTESTPDESGIITYTAEPLYGLQFSNPYPFGHLPPGDLVWKFFPGNSLSDEPDHSWPGWYMYDCERKLVCRFRPPVPGRMQVSAFVERQTAYVRSKPASAGCFAATPSNGGCGEQPKLVLVCNEQRENITLVRGSDISCAPQSDPEGTPVTVSGWQFKSATYTYPEDGDEPITDPEWAGKMVMSGTITVTAKVGASTTDQTASLTVTVTPRTTAPDQPELTSVRMGTIGELDPQSQPLVPPAGDEDLGVIEYRPVVFGTNDPALATTFFGFVTDGPNTHLAYLTKVPAQVDIIVVVNPDMRIGSDFWRKQPHFGTVATPTCVQERFPFYTSVILAHEGYPVNPQSHSGFYRQKVHELAWPAIEDIVRPDNELWKMFDDWRERLKPVFANATAYAATVDQKYPANFGCEFRYN